MRIAILASGVVTGGLIAACVLGVAAAETQTAGQPAVLSPPPFVSVQGVAAEPLAQNASAQSATAVYHQAMSEAVADGLAKAQLLAGKAAATLGEVQSVTEDGGAIQCAGETQYEGEAADFGSPGTDDTSVGFNTASRAAAPAGNAVSGKPPSAHAKHRKRHAAKKSSVTGCTLSAEVSLTYALS
jgi:hypothetical protein